LACNALVLRQRGRLKVKFPFTRDPLSTCRGRTVLPLVRDATKDCPTRVRGGQHTTGPGGGSTEAGRERMYELSCCGCSLKIFSKGGDRSSVSEVPNPDKSKSVSTPFCSGISPGDSSFSSQQQCAHVSRQEWAQLNRYDCPPASLCLHYMGCSQFAALICIYIRLRAFHDVV
jgi:hypothetical protein